VSDAPRRPRRAADDDVEATLPRAVRRDGLTYDRGEAAEHLRAVDPLLRAVIDAHGPLDIEPDPLVEPFTYLLRSIVFQQLNGTAAATIHGRVLDLFGGSVPTPHALLETSAETLRTAGVSGNKAMAMHDLARHALEGTLPVHDELADLSDLEIVERLTAVRGIGPWTVHMLLLFRLGRPDVLPTGDFGVREGYRLLHGLERQPTPTQLRAAAAPWRPYRSVASWYLYRAVDLHRAGALPVAPGH